MYLFPACAGVSRGAGAAGGNGSAIPRVCGGEPVLADHPLPPARYSPRVRG